MIWASNLGLIHTSNFKGRIRIKLTRSKEQASIASNITH